MKTRGVLRKLFRWVMGIAVGIHIIWNVATLPLAMQVFMAIFALLFGTLIIRERLSGRKRFKPKSNTGG